MAIPTATIAAVLRIPTTNRTLITTGIQNTRLICTVCDGCTTPRVNRSVCGHRSLNLLGCMRQRRCQIDQLSTWVGPVNIFNANPDLLLRDVNSRLDSEDHSWSDLRLGVAHVVNIQADVMPQSMDEVLPQRLAVQVLAMRVDVVVRDPVEGIRAGQRILARLEGVHRRL